MLVRESQSCLVKAISIEGLSVRLGNKDVLTAVDLELERGEWLNVIGANGAGKTTLLRCILGSVDYEGRLNIAGLSEDGALSRARMIAYVPQVPVIPPGMSVIDYVLLGRTPHRGPFAADSEQGPCRWPQQCLIDSTFTGSLVAKSTRCREENASEW